MAPGFRRGCGLVAVVTCCLAAIAAAQMTQQPGGAVLGLVDDEGEFGRCLGASAGFAEACDFDGNFTCDWVSESLGVQWAQESNLPGGKAGDALFVSARSCAGSDSGPGRIDLISPFVKVTRFGDVYIEFQHYPAMNNLLEGGVVSVAFYEPDDAPETAVWQAVPLGDFVADPPASIVPEGITGLSGLAAFAGSPESSSFVGNVSVQGDADFWRRSRFVVADADPGEYFRVRFTMAIRDCPRTGGGEGWYIDDFHPYTCPRDTEFILCEGWSSANTCHVTLLFLPAGLLLVAGFVALACFRHKLGNRRCRRVAVLAYDPLKDAPSPGSLTDSLDDMGDLAPGGGADGGGGEPGAAQAAAHGISFVGAGGQAIGDGEADDGAGGTVVGADTGVVAEEALRTAKQVAKEKRKKKKKRQEANLARAVDTSSSGEDIDLSERTSSSASASSCCYSSAASSSLASYSGLVAHSSYS